MRSLLLSSCLATLFQDTTLMALGAVVIVVIAILAYYLTRRKNAPEPADEVVHEKVGETVEEMAKKPPAKRKRPRASKKKPKVSRKKK